MAEERTFQRKVVIANGQTVSSAADCQGGTLVALSVPAAITGASFTFQGQIDGEFGYQAIANTSGTVVTWTHGGANRIICPVGADALIGGLTQIKVVSASAEGAARTIILHFVATNP